jgi:hypothetical protein
MKGGYRDLYNEELLDFYSSPSMRMTIPKRMNYALGTFSCFRDSLLL